MYSLNDPDNTRLTFMEAKGLTLCDWNLQSLDIGTIVLTQQSTFF